MSRLYCPTYLCLKEWRQLINIQDKLFKVELPTLLHVLCSIPPLKDMVTQEHLGEYQNIINEIFVTAPRAVMEENMNNQITIKNIPASIVYYSQTTLKKREEILSWIPEVGKACKELNPSLKCTEPYYGFCEYLDGEYKEEDVWVRYSEAVMEMGKESDSICFKELPATKVLSIYHCGSYDHMEQAYSSILKYAREIGYKITGLPRESYIDGIWNKEKEEDWLTEIQVPIQ